MFEVSRISCQQAQQIIAHRTCQIIDIRDEDSFNRGHVPGAQWLNNHNLQQFLELSDPDVVTLVFCYHGNSSQSAARLLTEKDFTEVHSVDGGFEQWRNLFPQQVSVSS